MTFRNIELRLKWAWAGLRGTGPIIGALQRMERLQSKLDFRESVCDYRDVHFAKELQRLHPSLAGLLQRSRKVKISNDYGHEVFVDRGKLPNVLANRESPAFIDKVDLRTDDEVLDAAYKELDTPKPRIVKVKRTVKRKKKAKK